MANKFQMSVKERLELESSKKGLRSSAGNKAEAEISEHAAKKDINLPIDAEITSTVKKSNSKEVNYYLSPELEQYLQSKPQREAKNKTFYLDVDVIQAIKHIAHQKGITDSKLVNDILRRILNV